MKLTFFGGIKTTSGANYLLEIRNPSARSGSTRILIDCGLHQGSRFAERQNFEPFPYDPNTIEAVLITHAHIDHTGLLPKLVKHGFRGKVVSTPPTRDFAQLLLNDSEHILGQEAEDLKLQKIYSLQDIEQLMTLWEGKEYHKKFEIVPGISATLFDAGHILGSAFILIEAAAEGEPRPPRRDESRPDNGREGKKIVFSGDLGNSPAPLLKPTDPLPESDFVVIESTYGDRIHENLDERREILEDTIEETVKNGGVLMIPAFAMERTQEFLYEIDQLIDQKKVPQVPVFLDSPLAIKATEIYQKYISYYNGETQQLFQKGHSIFNFRHLKKTLNKEESKAINDVPAPKIIIAGSGMSQGGRILHHEKRYLPDPKSTLLIIGYQAQGSLGRRLLDGEKTVKIHGETIQVRARIKAIGAYSAHADQNQLLSWLRPQRQRVKNVFVVQGEEESSEALKTKIVDTLAIAAAVPVYGQSVEL